jgi:hypothetical protein
LTGTLVIAANGALTYTPLANWNGVVTATYIVSDGVLTDTGQIEITVEPVNDPPIATTNVYSGTEDALLSGNVLTDDSGAFTSFSARPNRYVWGNSTAVETACYNLRSRPTPTPVHVGGLRNGCPRF